MTYKEFFVETLNDEMPRFERVFKSLPAEPADLRHHPKNKNVREIVETMVWETAVTPEMLKTGILDFSKKPEMKGTLHDLAVQFSKDLESVRMIAENMSDADWESPANMMEEGKSVWESTKGKMAWGLVLDLIHHRGQISTHIRAHGGKVPSIYGPSGDMEH